MKDLAIVVGYHDAYKVLWKPFFTLFKKYWPDCPFDKYLFSQTPDYPNVKKLIRGEGSWSTEIRKALKEVEEPYIFFHSEDGLYNMKVDNKKILELLGVMKKENICHLNINPLRSKNFPQFREYEDLVEIDNDSYRVNFQSGFWNKEVFLKILKDGETIWETEVRGTLRSYDFKPFVRVRHVPLLTSVDAVAEGKLTIEGLKYLSKEGFNFLPDTVFSKVTKFPIIDKIKRYK